MQETHDCVYCVVDLHAITVRQQKAELKRSTIETANMFLAAGVDPERSIVIVQSHVAQHSELAWILNSIAYMGELSRMIQFKEKSGGGEGESIGVGIFDYPVLRRPTSCSTRPTPCRSARTRSSTWSSRATWPSASTTPSARRSWCPNRSSRRRARASWVWTTRPRR